jgi:hypothetical protein
LLEASGGELVVAQVQRHTPDPRRVCGVEHQGVGSTVHIAIPSIGIQWRAVEATGHHESIGTRVNRAHAVSRYIRWKPDTLVALRVGVADCSILESDRNWHRQQTRQCENENDIGSRWLTRLIIASVCVHTSKFADRNRVDRCQDGWAVRNQRPIAPIRPKHLHTCLHQHPVHSTNDSQ